MVGENLFVLVFAKSVRREKQSIINQTVVIFILNPHQLVSVKSLCDDLNVGNLDRLDITIREGVED